MGEEEEDRDDSYSDYDTVVHSQNMYITILIYRVICRFRRNKKKQASVRNPNSILNELQVVGCDIETHRLMN